MKRIVVLGISSFLFWSCNSNVEKTASHQATAIQTTHHPDEKSGAIELNNGEKWAVNVEMKPFVLKGAELVNAFIQNKQTDYKALAKQLEGQNRQLIESCTMEGKSHEELHKWLHPHLKLVEELVGEGDSKHAQEMVDKLQASYQQYHQYFN